MSLYNIFTCIGGYRVTKWDSDFNVSSSYRVSSVDCDCPSRNKPCKHVSLVGQALAQGKIDTQYFYDDDTAHWHLIIPKELEMPQRWPYAGGPEAPFNTPHMMYPDEVDPSKRPRHEPEKSHWDALMRQKDIEQHWNQPPAQNNQTLTLARPSWRRI